MTAEEPPQDFSVFLHGLRTEELRRLPTPAKVVLSGGAAGKWYFDWFETNYPSDIIHHIGVEALVPEPPDLPRHIRWLPSTLGDLREVKSRSVDLVFAGEVIEHLWPDDIAAFLAEAHRVLRPGGTIALDSPNRRVTNALGWLHPEHTVEFTVDEIVELLGLAGFDEIGIRGLFLCYDATTHQFLGLDHQDGAKLSREDRVRLGRDRPEDSFVWWATATCSTRKSDEPRMHAKVNELFNHFRANRLMEMSSAIGPLTDLLEEGRIAQVNGGEQGVLLHGPYLPMPPGRWHATFELYVEPTGEGDQSRSFGWVDAVAGAGTRELGRIDLPAASVRGRWTRHDLLFALDTTTTGVEFRVGSSGAAGLAARARVDVRTAEPDLTFADHAVVRPPSFALHKGTQAVRSLLRSARLVGSLVRSKALRS
jgi:SAM-dependent methyltransferase